MFARSRVLVTRLEPNIRHGRIRGFVYDPKVPNRRFSVELISGRQAIAIQQANVRRADLSHRLPEPFDYGFSFVVPLSTSHDSEKLFRVRVVETRSLIENGIFVSPKPKEDLFDAALQDPLLGMKIEGWACDFAVPDRKLTISILLDDTCLGEVKADIFRADLLTLGQGDGYCGFRQELPRLIFDGRSHSISALINEYNAFSRNSPRLISPKDLVCASLRRIRTKFAAIRELLTENETPA